MLCYTILYYTIRLYYYTIILLYYYTIILLYYDIVYYCAVSLAQTRPRAPYQLHEDNDDACNK